MAKAVEVLRKGDILGCDQQAARTADGRAYRRRRVRDPSYGWRWTRWEAIEKMPAPLSGGVDADHNGTWCWRPEGPYAGSVRLPNLRSAA